MKQTLPTLVQRCASLLVLVCAALTTGCSTFISDPGLLDPGAQSATLRCYQRNYIVWMTSCSVSAVEGRRTGATDFANFSAKIQPGHRWVEFAVQTYFGGSGGTSEVCAFTLDFKAMNDYQIKAHSLKLDPVALSNTDVAPLQTGEMVVQVSSAQAAPGEVTVPVICGHGGGSLCRSTQDCVSSRHIKCVPQAPHAIGRCEPATPASN